MVCKRRPVVTPKGAISAPIQIVSALCPVSVVLPCVHGHVGRGLVELTGQESVGGGVKALPQNLVGGAEEDEVSRVQHGGLANNYAWLQIILRTQIPAL